MSDINTIDKEREDLSLHVDLCQQRYILLEKRLHIVEMKVDAIRETIDKTSKHTTKVLIGSAGSIVTGLLGLALAILMK